MQIKAFNLTERGSSHIKKSRECQDASKSFYCDDYGIAVVCDGHGGDDYIRSAVGSEKASQIAIESIKNFISEVDKDALKRHFDEVLNRLESNIISEWRKQVYEHWDSNPITDIEKSLLSEKAKRRYLENHKIASAYGTTLIAVVLTNSYWFCFQIGDGKCVWVGQDSKFDQLPLDKKCFLNATTSLCDSDALEHFQTRYSEELPAAVFIGSDGVDDCFKNDSQLYNFYKTICYSFGTNNVESATDELKDFLPRLSQKGSGDDISIAAVLNMDILPQITAVTSFNRDDEKAKKQQAEEIEAKRNEELKQEYEKKAEEARIKREEEVRRNQENSLNQAKKELEDAEKQLKVATVNQDRASKERDSLLERMTSAAKNAAGDTYKRFVEILNKKNPEFFKRDNELSLAKANYERKKKKYDEVVAKSGLICPNCKTVITASDKFCRNCGKPTSLLLEKSDGVGQNNQQQESNNNKNIEIVKGSNVIDKQPLITEKNKPLEESNFTEEVKGSNLKEEENELVASMSVTKNVVSDDLDKVNDSSIKGDLETCSYSDDGHNKAKNEKNLQEGLNANHISVLEEETRANSGNSLKGDSGECENGQQNVNIVSKTEYVSYTHKEYMAGDDGEAYSEERVDIIRQEES